MADLIEELHATIPGGADDGPEPDHPVDTWQSMDSAPKDGTRILGFTSFGIEPVRWHETSGEPLSVHTGWIGTEQDSTCFPGSDHKPAPRDQPILWRPFPQPPKWTHEADL